MQLSAVTAVKGNEKTHTRRKQAVTVVKSIDTWLFDISIASAEVVCMCVCFSDVINVTLSPLLSTTRFSFVWTSMGTFKSTHINAQSTFSFTHTERIYRFKSHWFPGPPRKAAEIMVEVNISLKCHWQQSADKNWLYLHSVKSLADYLQRAYSLAADSNIFTLISLSRNGKSSEQL